MANRVILQAFPRFYLDSRRSQMYRTTCNLDLSVYALSPASPTVNSIRAFLGHNMSVMGSQLEIDMDPDGDLTVVPRHQGQTGTGCYKLHDHQVSYRQAILSFF